jgi:tRNA(His) guanylyltransferase
MRNKKMILNGFKMKECEIFSDLKVPCGSKIVIRADGRNFSSLSNALELERPYDKHFANLMLDVCSDFFMEFSPQFIFTFSDEINVLLSEVPFNGRVEKLDSVFASFIAGSFTKNLREYFGYYNKVEPHKIKPISFDSRVIPLTDHGVLEYFKNRQNEAWRNCLNGYSYWKLREEYGRSSAVEILNKKKSSELHEILFERGLNISEVPLWHRRGIGIYKKEVPIKGYNPVRNENVISKRLRVYVDWELPLLNEEFFKTNSINCTTNIFNK